MTAATESKNVIERAEDAPACGSDEAPLVDSDGCMPQLMLKKKLTNKTLKFITKSQKLCTFQLSRFLPETFCFFIRYRPPINYKDVEVLAPMVRACTLPLRLECLKYGADLVYTEEMIDKKLVNARRHVNTDFGTVDYLQKLPERALIWTTCPAERKRLVCQLGTANANTALQAAMTVVQDVAAIDINMGCPKSFSVKGGMGAALLSTPEISRDILTTLRRNLPADVPVTCKIRILGGDKIDIAATREYMKMCEMCGVSAIAVHSRIREERPVQPAHWDAFALLKDAVNVPVLHNGDMFTRKQIDMFKEKVGADGMMLARGAMRNPALFVRGEHAKRFSADELTKEAVVRSYVGRAIEVGGVQQNTKWVLAQTIGEDVSFMGQPVKTFQQTLSKCKSMEAIASLVGYEGYKRSDFPDKAHTIHYFKDIVEHNEGGSVRKYYDNITDEDHHDEELEQEARELEKRQEREQDEVTNVENGFSTPEKEIVSGKRALESPADDNIENQETSHVSKQIKLSAETAV